MNGDALSVYLWILQTIRLTNYWAAQHALHRKKESETRYFSNENGKITVELAKSRWLLVDFFVFIRWQLIKFYLNEEHHDGRRKSIKSSESDYFSLVNGYKLPSY